MKKTTVIKMFGSATNVGRALGITRMAVSGWGDDIPELRVYQIERLINTAKENNVELSQLHLDQEGRVIYKVPKNETPNCIYRELKHLSIQTDTARG